MTWEQELGLKSELFPLFASAVGNDFVGLELLRPFHVSLAQEEATLPAGWQVS